MCLRSDALLNEKMYEFQKKKNDSFVDMGKQLTRDLIGNAVAKQVSLQELKEIKKVYMEIQTPEKPKEEFLSNPYK